MVESVAALISLAVLAVIVAADIWVYVDAKRCVAAGSPVFLRIGGLTIDTPVAWLLGCVIVWIFFFPMYFVNRSSS
jgi:hypothetical protein